MNEYGKCTICNSELEPGGWYTEYEEIIRSSGIIRTGRKRRSLSYLVCPRCGNKEIVDDSFDMPWYYEVK